MEPDNTKQAEKEAEPNEEQVNEHGEPPEDEPGRSKIEEETSEPEMMMDADDLEDDEEEDSHDGCDDGEPNGAVAGADEDSDDVQEEIEDEAPPTKCNKPAHAMGKARDPSKSKPPLIPQNRFQTHLKTKEEEP